MSYTVIAKSEHSVTDPKMTTLNYDKNTGITSTIILEKNLILNNNFIDDQEDKDIKLVKTQSVQENGIDSSLMRVTNNKSYKDDNKTNYVTSKIINEQLNNFKIPDRSTENKSPTFIRGQEEGKKGDEGREIKIEQLTNMIMSKNSKINESYTILRDPEVRSKCDEASEIIKERLTNFKMPDNSTEKQSYINLSDMPMPIEIGTKGDEVRETKNEQLTNIIKPDRIKKVSQSYTILGDPGVKSKCDEASEIINEQITNVIMSDNCAENKSYTILRDLQVETKSDEARKILNELLTKIIMPDNSKVKKSYTILGNPEVGSNSDESSEIVNVNDRLTNCIMPDSTEENQSYTTLSDLEVGRNYYSKPKEKETKTHFDNQIERGNHETRLRNISYTIIQKEEKTNIEKRLWSNNGLQNVDEKEKVHGKKEKSEALSEMNNLFFVHKEMRSNESSMNMNKKNTSDNPVKQLQNARVLWHEKQENVSDVDSDKFVRTKFDQSQLDSTVGIQEQLERNLQIKNNYSVSQNDSKSLKSNKNTVTKHSKLNNNKHYAYQNWCKLQLENVNVKKYIQQNSQRTLKDLKRKPCPLGNSNAEYYRTECDINLPRAQFVRIKPLLVPNNMLLYYEAKQSVHH